MRKEYDFKGAERGKFFRPGATMQLPIYLDAEVQTYFSKRAEKKGKSLDALLNEILKKEIALIETIE
jgi:hypothetical protein